MTARPFLVAVIGNPNTGKSTLFNQLTGHRQRVGNYPGVTVEKKTGQLDLGDRRLTLVDLPGAYSLAAGSPDERIAVDVLTGHSDLPAPDLVICVVDAANLRRNLFLAEQLADFGLPMVIALNMTDEAAKRGITVDVDRLAARLGIPVVPTVAVKAHGLDALKNAVAAALDHPRPARVPVWPAAVTDALNVLTADEGEPFTLPELRRVLFDPDSALLHRAGARRDRLAPLLPAARDHLFRAGMNPPAAEALIVYRRLDALLAGIETRAAAGNTFSDKLDRVLTHRLWGLPIFLAVMYVVFLSIYQWAEPLMNLINRLNETVQAAVGDQLTASPMLQSLVVDGILAGVGGVLMFLPQILILFFFIAVLEASGYMARAAFLTDKLFGWCGLNGKSFVPMLSGFACAVPAILATRTIEDRKARLVTMLITPLMSCSARLPVYVIMIGAFIEPRYGTRWAGFALFAIHLLGLALALPLAWLFTKYVFRGQAQPFLLELPPYRRPSVRNVLRRMQESGGEFVKRAGTIICAMSVIIWALSYFPRPDQPAAASPARHLEQSYIGQAGKFIQPAFAPAGFDWKITVGILASFPAREVMISTLGILYHLGTEVDDESPDLRARLAAEHWPPGTLRAGRPVFTVPVALAIMVFFALCMQCGATVIVIAREAGWRYGAFCFVYMTALAWLGAVLTYQIATRIFP